MSINGIVTAMSGTPFTVFDGNDFGAGLGAGNRQILRPAEPDQANATMDLRRSPVGFSAKSFTRITQDPNSPVQQFGSASRNTPGTWIHRLGLRATTSA